MRKRPTTDLLNWPGQMRTLFGMGFLGVAFLFHQDTEHTMML